MTSTEQAQDDIEYQLDFVKGVAADAEEFIIATLAKRGQETAQCLLHQFVRPDSPSRSRRTLILMVVACLSNPEVTRLLPKELNTDNLPPISELAVQYQLQNALEAAEEETDPKLRRALFQMARKMSAE